MKWNEIHGWFQWRSSQEEAVLRFSEGSRFVEVGNFLGRSLCSLAEVAQLSGKRFTLIGVDTCRGTPPQGPLRQTPTGNMAVTRGGTFAGILHKNIVDCGFSDMIALVVTDSINASTFFADSSIEWVHLDASKELEYVKADIAAWLPKLRVGGWLSGDDYSMSWPGVVQAVNETLPGAEPWSRNQWRYVVR